RPGAPRFSPKFLRGRTRPEQRRLENERPAEPTNFRDPCAEALVPMFSPGDWAALIHAPSRGRKRLAARLWRAAERQARKLEFALAWDFQRKEDRAHDLAALRELTRILRDLSALEDSTARAEIHARVGEAVEREEALAVEGRAVFVRREKRG
ncbi:MAG TPA: hypothetical protein VGA77_08130, partial [Propylenella sp.]